MQAVIRSVRPALVPCLTLIVVLAGWQAVTVSGLFRPDQFPTMSDTLAATGTALGTAELWTAVGATLQGWAIGLAVAAVLAVIVGSMLGAYDPAFRSAAGLIEVFKAIPAIAILPLVILVLGSTPGMKVFLVAFGAFWPLVVQVIYGVRAMDPTVADTARALGVRGVRRFAAVTLPSASPYVATGLRIASASALILAVVAELVGGAEGIGRRILFARNAGVTAYPTMYAYILVAGVLGIVLTGAFFLVERKGMHWHESRRGIGAGGPETR